MIRVLIALLLALLPAAAHAAGITETNVGLVINDLSGRSIDEGRYVKKRRAIPDANVFHVRVAEGKGLSATACLNLLSNLKSQLAGRDDIKVLALAWAQPHNCAKNGMTSAVGMGLQPYLANDNGASLLGTNPFYGSTAGIPPNVAINPSGTGRLAVQVIGQRTEDTVKMTEDGIASDATRPASVIAIIATDTPQAANKRRFIGHLWTYNNEPMQIGPVKIVLEPKDHSTNISNVMFEFWGNDTLNSVENAANNVNRLPGALAFNTDSYSGLRKFPTIAQPLSNTLEGMIRLGAQGSAGPVSEPWLWGAKFPNAKCVITNYINGDKQSVVMWRCLEAPANSNMIAEVLACPWCFTKGPDVPAPKPVGNACTSHWKLYIKEPANLPIGSVITWSVLGGNGAVVKQGATKVTTGGLINFGAVLDFPVEGPASLIMQPGGVRQLCNVVIWS